MESPSESLPTGKAKSSRAGTSRKQAVNQTLSCAECRRLKLRCDRVFPCSSCQKRGIAELCPEGSLPTRNKPVNSSTDKEQLYHQISELRGRVLELEKALEVSHAAISSDPHPLLGDDNFPRKTLNKRKKMTNGSLEDEGHGDDEPETLEEAIGSLNVDEEGRTRYFGRSACVERLFKYQNNGALTTPKEPNILVSAEVAMIYQSFPMLTVGEATGLVQERIWRHLPPVNRAQTLRQNYRRHVHHITDIVPENSDWFDALFSRVYQSAQTVDVPLVSFSDSGVKMDELALLYAYYAMAALMDLDLKPFNYEAEAYACLSRAALTSMNLLKNPTVVTVETLVLLGYFEAMWGEVIGSGDGWMITALATKLAQFIGVHRNSRQFGTASIEPERRSRIYWEVYTLELMEGLAHGRPSTFSMIPSDVEMPTFKDPKKNMHAFRYRLAAECFSPLSKQVFGVKVPTYTTVVELDRKIRAVCADFGIGLQGQPASSLGESEAILNYMKRVLRESTLMYLHRAFFVRAVAANPSDPQHTKYGLSVSGAYESGMNLVQALGEVSQEHPAAASRALLCWSHTLCAVFILGTITTRCPGSRLAPLAGKRLHDVEELYKRGSVFGGRASADKPLVSRMAEKCDHAANAYATEHNKGTKGLLKRSASPGEVNGKHDPENDEDDALALLGGYTRVINSTKRAAPTMAPAPQFSGLVPPGGSPALRNASPLSADQSFFPESGSYNEQYRWNGSHPTTTDYRIPGQLQGQRSSSPSDTTDHHGSSGGSVSSGLSPEAGVPATYAPVQQDPFTQIESARKPYNTYQTQHLGPNYQLHDGLPDSGMLMAGHDDAVRIVEDHGVQDYPPQRSEFAPMEVSMEATEPQEWNFLDSWYGHVFSMDVFPPDYGK